MDPHFFFEGTQREEAASAFLAMLLEQDPGFRAAFVRRIGGGEAGAARPKVMVEPSLGGGSWPDIVMVLPELVVLVENKLRPGTVRTGQLARYHLAAVGQWPRRRIISAFLAPDARLGFGEARSVRREIRRAGRDDRAVVLTWAQVRWLARFASTPDTGLRAAGFRSIAEVIDAYQSRGQNCCARRGRRGPGAVDGA
jgi:hypothetical protein